MVVRRPIDRDDVVQEVNLRLLRKGVEVLHVACLPAYVARMAKNIEVSATRVALAQRTVAMPHNQLERLAAGGWAGPWQGERSRLDALLPLLGDRDRGVLIAWFAVPMVKSVARSLGLDVRQVKRSLARCAFLIGQMVGDSRDEARESCPPAASVTACHSRVRTPTGESAAIVGESAPATRRIRRQQ